MTTNDTQLGEPPAEASAVHRQHGLVAVVRCVYAGIAAPLILVLLQAFFGSPATLPPVTLLLVALMATLLSGAYLILRYLELAAEWDDETLRLFWGGKELTTERWENLTSVRWIAPFNLGLTFQGRREWVIPREWTEPYSADQRHLREMLLRAGPRATSALSMPFRTSGASGGLSESTLLWAVWGATLAIAGSLLLINRQPAVVFLTLTSLGSISLAVAWPHLRPRVMRHLVVGQVLVSDKGLRRRGTLINWADLNSMEWSGPQHLTLHIRGERQRWRMKLTELTEGEELKAAILAQPSVRVVWQRQTGLSRDLWFLAPSVAHVVQTVVGSFFLLAALYLVWAMARGVISGWQPMFGIATGLYFGLVGLFSARPIRMSAAGIQMFPSGRVIRYDEVTSVSVNPATGAVTVRAGARVVDFPGDWVSVGRVLAILRARVSADAFEDGDDFPEKGDDDESNP